MRGFQSLGTAAALVAAVVLVLAGIGLSLWFERTYEQQKSEEIGAQARILAATSTAALTFNDRQAAREYVNALAANPDVETAAIYDTHGALFAGFSRMRGKGPQQEAPTTRPLAASGRWVTAPVRQGTSRSGRFISRPFPTR